MPSRLPHISVAPQIMVKIPANFGFQVRPVVSFSIHAPNLGDISLSGVAGVSLSFWP